MLLLNGAVLAAAIFLFFAWPLFLTDEDYAGSIWLGICALIGVIGARLALKDRYELIATGMPQAAPASLWMPLSWVAAAGAGVAIGSGVSLVAMCFAFGSARDSCVALAAVVVLGAVMLITAVVSVVRWLREARK